MSGFAAKAICFLPAVQIVLYTQYQNCATTTLGGVSDPYRSNDFLICIDIVNRAVTTDFAYNTRSKQTYKNNSTQDGRGLHSNKQRQKVTEISAQQFHVYDFSKTNIRLGKDYTEEA